MRLHESGGGLYAGLAVAATFIAVGLFFVTVEGAAAGALGLVMGALFGGASVYGLMSLLDLTVDMRGIHGKRGRSHIDLAWDQIERVEAAALGRMHLHLRDGRRLELRTPGWLARDLVPILEEMRRGKVVRVLEKNGLFDLGKTIPGSVEAEIALEKRDGQLLSVNILLGGPHVEDIAVATRILALRAADENRWDPTFSGKIRFRVSSPLSDELRTWMDSAMAGAQIDLLVKEWTAAGGAQFSLSWEVVEKKS